MVSNSKYLSINFDNHVIIVLGDVMSDYDTLLKWINDSRHIVFFGGAGVSTASGIKDFRSKDGLYNMKYKYPPEEILSHSFFINNNEEFYRFYVDKMNCLDKVPNICHNYLTKLEELGKLDGIVTQNIDGLHELAGSKHIYNLHGSIYENECMKCHKKYTADDIFLNKTFTCSCGGMIKPNVVLYEEPLDSVIINEAIETISGADLLIVAGTSLTVYPASSFVSFFKGSHLVIINRDTTIMDNRADLVIHDDIKDVFEYLDNLL